ncbi:MAG: cytochrome P450 [Dehalococcoidia bacterium]
MGKDTGKTLAATGPADLLRLIGGLARGILRRPISLDSGLVLSNWIRGVTRRRSDNVVINLLFKKLLLVTGRDLSEHILGQPPSTQTYMEGPTKVRAMSFLAPQGLTICHDRQWQRLRHFNVQVLSTGLDPARQQAFLDQVHQAFARPVSGVNDVRECMGQAMLGVVFGEQAAPAHLAEDIPVLFGYVRSPLRRKILGGKERGRRERFYATLRQLWRDTRGAQHPSLLATAQGMAQGEDYDEEELLQQIPHWMFTFTGSGTDLLARTLAVVGARPQVADKVREEIAAAGPLDQPFSIDQLDYLEACLRETCRLFPPVTSAFHVAPQGDRFGDTSIPAGVEICHYFPLSHRDVSADPRANHFEPERWLDPANEARSSYPNLFLSGARACPGEGLILFICKAAIAILLDQRRIRVHSDLLSRDPLPFSFPQKEVRFTN